jgi:hypothetical protein
MLLPEAGTVWSDTPLHTVLVHSVAGGDPYLLYTDACVHSPHDHKQLQKPGVTFTT